MPCSNTKITEKSSNKFSVNDLGKRKFSSSYSRDSKFNKVNKLDLIGLGPNSKLLKQYKESLGKLSQVQREAAIGLMLGDGSLQTQNNGKTYRMKFEWGNKNKVYLDHVYNLFYDWVLMEPHKKVRISPNGNEVINWGFQTISHEAFNDLAQLFLDKNVKSISTDLIKNHLTPRGFFLYLIELSQIIH